MSTTETTIGELPKSHRDFMRKLRRLVDTADEEVSHANLACMLAHVAGQEGAIACLAAEENVTPDGVLNSIKSNVKRGVELALAAAREVRALNEAKTEGRLQ